MKSKFPKSLWGGITTSIINSVVRNIELKKGVTIKNIYESFFPFTQNAKSYYFLYGKNGFRAYQVLISNEHVNEFIDGLIKLIKKYSADITIIGIKPFRGEQKFLQFCRNGMSIILEMKNSQNNINFLSKLDELSISHNALPYIIKDSRLPKSVVEKCYPQYEKFQNILYKVDPDKVFTSYTARKLGL
jgi:decaprenylphospho-beta-D-ribofuranose 2-oxidase